MSEEQETTSAVTPPPVATATAQSTVPIKERGGIGTKDLLIPISIVLAGIFIGAGLFLSSGGPSKVAQQGAVPNQEPTADTTNKVDPVTEKDHYVGNINAPVKIIEYSDFECPFCKKFHATLETVSQKYGDKVVWVYRQFPLEQLHKKAVAVSMASECAAELGGNEAFWKFTNGYYDATLSNDRTDLETVIPKLVSTAGLNQKKFNECTESGRHQGIIDAHIADAVETGGRGTPWTIVIGPNGKTYAINGAQPQSVVEQTIKTALEAK